MTDPLDQLSALRPTTATLEAEWPAAERGDVRRGVVSRAAPRSRFRPGNTRRVALPAAALLVAAATTGLLVALLPGGGTTTVTPGSGTDVPVVDTPVVGPGQAAVRRTIEYAPVGGRLVATQDTVDYVAPSGELWSARGPGERGRAELRCVHDDRGAYPQRELAQLPVDPLQLEARLRTSASGSSSVDEAVFVAVGDTLGSSDLLATSRLRASLVAVLGRTAGVTLHRAVRDSRDRSTIRADFVDSLHRPGVVASLFFDPDTFQLLQQDERQGKAITRRTTMVSEQVGVQPKGNRCP